MTEWTDDPDARYDEHAHPHREVRVILAGGMTVVAGGVSFDLRASDRIDLDSDEPHSARVHADGVAYLAGSGR